MIPRILTAIPCAVLLLAGTPAECADISGPAVPRGLRRVPASDTHFRYDGRVDLSDRDSPVIIWEASTISIDFDGDRASARFGAVTGQVFFNASVDGVSTILALREGRPLPEAALALSGGGRHHLVLFKRSEAAAGTARFLGIDISAGAAVHSPPVPYKGMRIEFFGDSITAGACDEDGATDQWNDRRTHNAAYSWAALVAAHYSADYRNTSISGIGVVAGYDDILMGQVWDRMYPSASSARAGLAAWVPDAVFILLGDNDDSYTRAHSLPFPANFRERYASLVRAIRAAYPGASIVLLNGGMWAGIHSRELESAWNATVAGLEASDPAISHYTFGHWTMNHPRVADHKALAEELEAWLGSRPSLMARR